MEALKNLNEELKKHLDSISEVLINDLISLLNGENINYLDGKNRNDIDAFNFEYLHDHFDTTFFATDKNGIKITVDLKLPLTNRKLDFLPQTIWDRVNEIEGNDEEEEPDESLEEYNEEKYEIFDSWFSDCWEAAAKEVNDPVTAYFSTHELDFGIELNSLDMVEINKDQIDKRRYIV